MKHLIFLLIFAMATMVATAQEPATDTSYIEYREGAFWRVTISQELISVDTAATVNAIIGEIYPRLEQYANAAVLTINLAKARKLIANAGKKLTALTGGNYYSQLDTDLGDAFLGDYSIKVDGGGGIAVSVIRAGGGTGGLRFKQGATNFNFDVVTRNWVRIRRYQGTTTQTPDTNVVIDLFLDGNFWKDQGGRFVLRKL
jgi:hypothetical protein